MIFHIEINDEMIEAARAIEDPIERQRAEAAVLAAIDLEMRDLRRSISDWAIGNVKETV